MAWYGQRLASRNPLTALGSPVWTEARVNSPLMVCSVKAFRFLVQNEQDITQIALVFASEGEFDKGVFTFKYEFSDRMPIPMTRDIAFKINRFIFGHENDIKINAFDHCFKSAQGRQFLLELVKTLNDRDGGIKVMADKPPPQGGPSNKLSEPVYAGENENEMEA